MEKNRKQLIEEIAGHFHAIKNKMSGYARSGIARHDGGITHAQQFALMKISQCKDSGIKEVSTSLCTTSSAATQLVNELVKQGLVTRKINKKDRRALDLAISKKGQKHIAEAKKLQTNMIASLFENLSEKELEQFITLNKKILI